MQRGELRPGDAQRLLKEGRDVAAPMAEMAKPVAEMAEPVSEIIEGVVDAVVETVTGDAPTVL